MSKNKIKDEVSMEEKISDQQIENSINSDEDKMHTDKLNEAYNKISELEDKLIRQNADTVNFRKRKEEEINKMLKFCNEDLIKDILPILDNFERAINMDDGLTEVELKFLDGFKMVYSHLQNIMEKYDVKMIDGNNKPFDPVYHNAILVEKKDGVEPGMVIEVLQKGYLLKDKVIRTAMVKVSE
jgi:molecular chaperone GrpE